MGRRTNGKREEVGRRQTEENDEKVVVGMVEPKVQLIRALYSQFMRAVIAQW